PYCVGRLSHSEPDGRAPVFFQAEDGIRDFHVTGVQTCALPILRTCGKALGCEGALVCGPAVVTDFLINRGRGFIFSTAPSPLMAAVARAALAIVDTRPDLREALRSEERRVGKGCRSRWWEDA